MKELRVAHGTCDTPTEAALVISLDFELHWGVSESVVRNDHPYMPNLYGAREVVPRLLALFRQRDIHATWATVGKLMAQGRDDLQKYIPSIRPRYDRSDVDTYRIATGVSEAEDPLHFAHSLVAGILDTSGQELACHTFCHYFCDEPGQDLIAFEADLQAAQSIAARYDGASLRSLVFPRNQVITEYVDLLPHLGFDVYRGNPPKGMYHLYGSRARRYVVRILRVLDSYINVTGYHIIPWKHIGNDVSNVCASHFLRPYNPKLWFLESLRRRRVVAGMKAAVEENGIFHLWWHPHNFGANLEENIASLEAILDEFERLREKHGMRSLTMAEVADEARSK